MWVFFWSNTWLETHQFDSYVLFCGSLQMCSRGKKLRQQSVYCHQTWGSQQSQKETKKEKQNWFYSWALLTLTGSFEVDRLIVLFRMTTKKWNVYGDHRRINGRHHMFVCSYKCVCVVCHMNVFDPGQRSSSHSFSGSAAFGCRNKEGCECDISPNTQWPLFCLSFYLTFSRPPLLNILYPFCMSLFSTASTFSFSFSFLLVQGDCRTREEALILGVELCDNGFMHHGTALFTAEDFNRPKKKVLILLFTNRGILSITD